MSPLYTVTEDQRVWAVVFVVFVLAVWGLGALWCRWWLR